MSEGVACDVRECSINKHCTPACMLHKDYVKQVEEKFGKDGSKLLKMKGADFSKLSGEIYGAMQTSLAKATGDSLLKNYSPWLHNFDSTSIGQSIEVPGEDASICEFVIMLLFQDNMMGSQSHFLNIT